MLCSFCVIMLIQWELTANLAGACASKYATVAVRRASFIAAYILYPLLSQYDCSHIVNLKVIWIYHDAIVYHMSLSFSSILSISSVVVQFIAFHHAYAHKPVLILVICFIYVLSISHTDLFDITCIYSLPE